MQIVRVVLMIFCFPFFSIAQQTINGTIMHDGLQREYILYVPAMYSSDTPVPLVLNFHGYTSNDFEQMFYGDFRPIADTANFIIVHPLGTLDLLNNTHWNVGWGTSLVDDVGFAEALIDSLSGEYNINPNRIYSTGMSNGGFMSYQLACKLSDRIAAIASVTGAMTIGTPATCNPEHPTPVMEIHGTADQTVPYGGNILFESIPSGLNYWAGYNHTDALPTITDVDDLDPNDGSTVEHHNYPNGDNGVVIEHYKVINGAHTWPGTAFTSPGTNHDINASKEIWRFFSQYDIHGLINTTATEPVKQFISATVYPNPATSTITIVYPQQRETPFELANLMGQPLLSGVIASDDKSLDISELPAGMYLLRIEQEIICVMKVE